MKKLIIVSGTMGVGKSSTCRELYRMAPRTAWLDGDWCWLMNPWDMCEQNKKMVMDNITHILRSYLASGTIDNVVFSWVLHRQDVIDELLGRLDGFDFELSGFCLTCTPERLQSRMRADGRDIDDIKASVERLRFYPAAGWSLIDTSNITPGRAAEMIAEASGMAGARFLPRC